MRKTMATSKNVTSAEAKKAAKVLSVYAKQKAVIAKKKGTKVAKHAAVVGKKAVASFRKRFKI